MLLGRLYFALFVAGGAAAGVLFFYGENAPVRAWLGAALGQAALMWLPALCAFFLSFGMAAHVFAAGLYAAALAVLWRRRGDVQDAQGAPPLGRPDAGPIAAGCGLPLAVGLFMMITYTLRPQDGGLYTGQSGYGDMALHLGIVQSLWANGQFPPEYSIFPGARLGYPFLGDALSASMRVMGMPLRYAYMLPGMAALLFVFFGFYVLAKTLLKSRSGAALACALFFVGGGFGFAYFMDNLRADPWNLTRIFTGFYEMPTNDLDYNLRWTNVVVDMLVPQRTLLVGWALLLPCLYMLVRSALQGVRKLFLPLGVLAGALPLVHTHSFLALGVLSAVLLVWALLRDGRASAVLRAWLPYALPALLLALPQLIFFTFRQSDSESFVRLGLNWCNETDAYIWFYLKNLGLIGLLVPVGVMCARPGLRRLLAGALVLWVICEVVLFQPNPYDNNKLMLIAYMVACIAVAGGMQRLFEQLRGVPGRRYIAAVTLFFCTLSGLLTFGRGVWSNEYELFSQKHVQAAEEILRHTPGDAIFLTAQEHNNAVAALAGRRVVCGTSIYLFFHGLHIERRLADVAAMYRSPKDAQELYRAYQVDYVYVSDYELADIGVNMDELAALYPVWYQAGGVTIFAVSQRAQGGR